MGHNNQKKIAAINDYTGFGRCSIAVELPVISALKVQCCPLPTSVLSNHTGFDSFYFEDFFKTFKTDENIILVDPVMGDYGKLYSTYTTQTCTEMKKLVKYADILTPNLTEACILTDEEYDEKCPGRELFRIAKKLSDMGPSKIAITGIVRGKYIANYCYEKGSEGYEIKTMKVGTQRSGTGDIFASILAADAVNGVDFHTSVKKASQFIKKCILKSIELDIPVTDGVCFEELLTTLR